MTEGCDAVLALAACLGLEIRLSDWLTAGQVVAHQGDVAFPVPNDPDTLAAVLADPRTQALTVSPALYRRLAGGA